MRKTKNLIASLAMLLASALLLTTASFAWFSMNTSVKTTGIEFVAYSDSLFLEISKEDDKGFGDAVDFFGEGKESIRLITLSHLTDGAYLLTPKPVEDGRRYRSDVDGDTLFYMKRTASSTNDSHEGDNYILINSKLKDASGVGGYYKVSDTEKNIVFNMVKTKETYSSAAGGKYYERVGNSYVPVTEESGALVDGVTSLLGLFKVELGTACADGELYDGKSTYFKISKSGTISPVGALKEGTLLENYYTIEIPDEKTLTADGENIYHIKNSQGDFVSIGKPEASTSLTDYIYFGRSYSSTSLDAEADNTLGVIRDGMLDSYCVMKTVYLRSGVDANPGSNLSVSGVTVSGDDSLTDALSLLIVATNGEGEVSRATYSNRDKKITHLDGSVSETSDDGETTTRGILFPTVSGKASEIITVKIYIYYDGRDASSISKDANLSGHAVDIEFSIDKPEYIKN